MALPNFTPVLHGWTDYEDWFPSAEPSAHEVIGQEFDDVAGLISDKMYYDANENCYHMDAIYIGRTECSIKYCRGQGIRYTWSF